jgi:hypothetical protein
LAACSAGRAAIPGISWEVENRFPLLGQTSFNRIAKLWNDLPKEKRTMWQFIRSRMEAKEAAGNREEFLLAAPPIAAPATNLVAPVSDLGKVKILLTAEGTDCRWTVKPAPLELPKDGECRTAMTIPADTAFRVDVQGPGINPTSTDVRVREIVIVAMGDSYASGEGSPDRPAIYPANAKTPHSNDWFMRGLPAAEGNILPAVWWDPVCHRSLLSWPVLASLRLALENPRTVVQVVDVACSGAEFLDGFFWSQAKADFRHDDWGPTLTSIRDGLGRRTVPPTSGHFLQRSQVNAVRDALCARPSGDLSTAEDIDLPNRAFLASMRPCKFKRKPDALMLTAGGNDIRFAAAVKGVLTPSVAKRPIFGPAGLALARAAMGTISPSELAANAKNWTLIYPSYLEAIQHGVGADAARTVLLAYPNPVGSKDDSCIAGSERARVRNAFMTLGPFARVMAPAPVRTFIGEWTVEIDPKELRIFTEEAYGAVHEMQNSVHDRLVEWHPVPGDIDPLNDRSFSDRLLCRSTQVARNQQLTLEPTLFCSSSKAGPDECAVYKVKDETLVDADLRRHELTQWKFEVAGRRMTNSTNDALLAQRSWNGREPSDAEITYAIAGAMHPVTESHAVGADSAYKRLAKILKDNPLPPAD